MQKIYLQYSVSQRILAGHPWIFDNEVKSIPTNIENGSIVEVYDKENKFVGRGGINANSKILIRLLTRNQQENIDKDFFHRKLQEAWALRTALGYTQNCRLVFGESDGLSGLIIDKFGDYFVLQTLSLCLDKWKKVLVEILVEMFRPKGIYERNDVPVRELEGLPQQKGFLHNEFSTQIIIQENGLSIQVDVDKGQKTGYFLDQHENRKAIQHIVKDADVLEAFCYVGSFSIHAAHYGAKKVLGIDVSEWAVAQAQENAKLNGLESVCSFQAINAFDQLKIWEKEKRKWDIVILDPPAFTKSRENIKKAITGYKEINLRAMKLVKPGGFLVSASCTNLVNPELFLQIIDMAARDVRKSIKQIYFNTQAKDHPILWHIENTQYLKFLIAQIG